MRLILYIFYLLLIAFYNTIVAGLISISGVTIDLAGLIVIIIAMYKGEGTALWFGVAAGIVTATPTPALMPWEILALSFISVAGHQICIRINMDSIPSRLITMAGFLAFHGAILTLAMSGEAFVFSLYRYILPAVGYTLLLGWLLLLIGDGIISLRKVQVLA